MSEVTRILEALEQGDPDAAGQLLPLAYNELRRLAARKLAREGPGHTLQPTTLVQEVYLRLLGAEGTRSFKDHGHFLAAAATAMRRILIDNARRRRSHKRGGGRWKASRPRGLMRNCWPSTRPRKNWRHRTRTRPGWWNCVTSPA